LTAGQHRARSVVPVVCSGGQFEHETALALIGSYLHADYGRLLAPPIAVIAGPRLYANRTRAVRLFLETQGEWALWFDTDMDWADDAPFELLRAADLVERPIVGGLCFGTGRSGGGLFPTIFQMDDHGAMGTVVEYPKDTLVECAGTGMAFCLVHRSVYEKMAQVYDLTADGHEDLFPWFVDGQIGAVEIEADLAFCIRARSLGFPIHVHTGVRTAHKKVQLLTEEFYELVRRLQEEQTS
jgi:hypothetical protein